MQAQKQSFLERKQKVEELDNKRFEGARIVDTVNQLVPDGAYLTSIQNIGGSDAVISNTYTLVGKAISDNKVAMFMTALPSTGSTDSHLSLFGVGLIVFVYLGIIRKKEY